MASRIDPAADPPRWNDAHFRDLLWLPVALGWLMAYACYACGRALLFQHQLWVLEFAVPEEKRRRFSPHWLRSGYHGDLTANRCPPADFAKIVEIGKNAYQEHPETVYRVRRVFRRQALLIDLL